MKKSSIIIVLVTLFCYATAYSQQRSQQGANEIAKSFFHDAFGESISTARSRSFSKTVETYAPYYTIKSSESSKTVVISGDERMKPVLGYYDSNIEGNEIPLGMQDLLQGYNEIYNKLQQLSPSTNSIENYPSSSIVVEPLIQSAWGQGRPYNYMCPTYGSNSAITGCVATAMAQIMNYYQYPAMGKGKCSYNTETFGLYVYANLDNKIIDWKHIKHDYRGSYNTEERDAVANLMFYCGASVQMNYGLGASGAYVGNVASALTEHFDYMETANFLANRDFSNAQWTEMINSELQAKRPILYASYSDNYSFGHAYVVDGINAEGLYHINWGWDGDYNGYFALDCLQPYEDLNISVGQEMVLGIQPKGYQLAYMVDGKLYYITYLNGGDQLPAIEDPVKNGYTFTGWQNAPTNMPNSSLVLNAVFTQNKYKVSFIVDEQEYDSKEIAYGTEVPYPELSTKDGYTFSGWSESPKTMPAKDLTISGTYSKNKYTITYYLDDEEYHSETIEYDEKIKAADGPVVDGYTFSGWSDIPETMPANNLSIYGKLTKDDETIHPDYSLMADVIYTPDTKVFSNIESHIDIKLNNSKDVTGFQFELTIPAGAKLQSITKGNRVPSGMNFTYKEDSNNTYKVICYSTQKLEILPEEGNIANVNLIFEEPNEKGLTSVVKICKQVISYKDNSTSNIKDVYATITSELLMSKLTYFVDSEEYKVDTLQYGAPIKPIESPTKPGYTFSGWSEAPTTMPANDLTIQGSFVVNQYIVKFIANDTIVSEKKQDFGTAITTPEAPAKEGYTFKTWGEVAETMPANDVTYTAEYTINQYKVIFKVDGEEYKVFTLDYGSAITVPESPTKEGFTFSGWSDVAETVPANDVTYEATFGVNLYTIKFIADGKIVSEKKQDFGTAITAPEAPAKEGYTFKTWGEVAETMPANDVTYTAEYTINQYTVKFIADGKVVSEQKQDYASVITAPEAPAKQGYSFVSWGNVAETVPAEDVTYEAQYAINKYKIKYIVDGKEYKSSELDYATAITAEAAPTKTGYTFSGWSTIPETMPAEDVTITGTFTVNQYKVIFKVDGEEYKVFTLDYGSAITVPESPTKEGFTFSGWDNVAETVPAEDVIYEAQFAVNQYTIRWKADGKLISMRKRDFGATFEYPKDPTKEGYTFIGWSDTITIVPAHDVTFNAQFKVNKYTVTYYVDDNEYHVDTLDYGAELFLPEPPEKQGFIFAGWGDVAKTMPANDLEYHASFKRSTLKGDVNIDGKINATDVVSVYNYIINGSASGIEKTDADINEDDVVNASDVVSIYNIIIFGD